jgi:hypothetical protein
MLRFKVIGRQVACANGIIDILGVAGFTPVIVELKAEQATEKVAGQVLRYRDAVQDAFEGNVYNLLITEHDNKDITLLDDLKPICIVIAPSYHHKAIAALAHMGWLCEAHRFTDGTFAIGPFNLEKRYYRYEQPKLEELLQTTAAEYVGWRLGVAMANNHRRLLTERLPFEP